MGAVVEHEQLSAHTRSTGREQDSRSENGPTFQLFLDAICNFFGLLCSFIDVVLFAFKLSLQLGFYYTFHLRGGRLVSEKLASWAQHLDAYQLSNNSSSDGTHLVWHELFPKHRLHRVRICCLVPHCCPHPTPLRGPLDRFFPLGLRRLRRGHDILRATGAHGPHTQHAARGRAACPYQGPDTDNVRQPCGQFQQHFAGDKLKPSLLGGALRTGASCGSLDNASSSHGQAGLCASHGLV